MSKTAKPNRPIEVLLAIVDDETNAQYHTLTKWEHARIKRYLKRREVSLGMARVAAASKGKQESS